MKGGPYDRPVEQEIGITQQEGLTENDRGYSNIHRISNVTVEPFDDQVLGRQNWSGGAQPFHSKASEGFKQNREAQHDQQDSYPA